MPNKPTQPKAHPETSHESEDERTGATPEMRKHVEAPKGVPTSDRQEMERTALKDHNKPEQK